MLKTGTTCFLEPMLPSSANNEFSKVIEAVGESGIRACIGKLIKIRKSDDGSGIPDDRDGNANEMSVEKAIAAHSKYHGSYDGRIHVWMAPETPRGQDEAGFRAAGTACLEHNIRVTVHCAEDARDTVMIKEAYKATPAQFLRNAKLTGPHVVLGHMET